MKDFSFSKTVISDWDIKLANALIMHKNIHYEKELNTQDDIDKYCELLNQEKEDDILGKI